MFKAFLIISFLFTGLFAKASYYILKPNSPNKKLALSIRDSSFLPDGTWSPLETLFPSSYIQGANLEPRTTSLSLFIEDNPHLKQMLVLHFESLYGLTLSMPSSGTKDLSKLHSCYSENFYSYRDRINGRNSGLFFYCL